MWVADMDFLSPPAVMAALHRRIDHGVFGYAAPQKALVETVMAMLEASYGWHIDPEWLVWLPGLVSGVNIACRTVGDPGSGILTTLPIYPPFLSAPKLAGRVLQTTTMINDHGYWQWTSTILKPSEIPGQLFSCTVTPIIPLVGCLPLRNNQPWRKFVCVTTGPFVPMRSIVT